MWTLYFILMLSGAVVGLKRKDMHFCFWKDSAIMALSVTAFFATWRCGLRWVGYEWLQVVSIVFLTLTVVYLYRIANAESALKLANSWVGRVLIAIGGLCLEVYLSHRVFIVDGFNTLFPANLIILFIGIVLLAYIVRVVTRFMLQTFNGEDGYMWREIFRI